jgi:3-phytase
MVRLGGLIFALVAGAFPYLAASEPVKTMTVTASAETEPVGTQDDAADDPAIWRNPRFPQKSLIVATDKKAGLHVYNLEGKALSFHASPRPNNVDLRDGVRVRGKTAIFVAASDRADVTQAHVALFRLDSARGRLKQLARLPVGPGEAYGMCLWQPQDQENLQGFMVMKDGRIDQFEIDSARGKPRIKPVRTMKLSSQAEGCVADDRTGLLYVAEEDVGIWRFSARADGPLAGEKVAAVDNRWLFADVEGLALAPQGAAGGHLIASSQGDNSFVLFRLPDLQPVGRFRVDAGIVDAVQETDGVDVMLGDFGPAYPGGLLVAQDGDNLPATQNFKLLPWAAVSRALKLAEKE